VKLALSALATMRKLVAPDDTGLQGEQDERLRDAYRQKEQRKVELRNSWKHVLPVVKDAEGGGLQWEEHLADMHGAFEGLVRGCNVLVMEAWSSSHVLPPHVYHPP